MKVKDTARESDGDRGGRVVTFYSYKGGTGRTMTLANAAWILAANGKRVLTVDWDLEAPGLYRFFHPFLDYSSLSSVGGVVNMINNYLEQTSEAPGGITERRARESGHAAVSGHAISLSWEFPGGGSIDFISAGKQNEDYSTILNGLNWDDFYQDYEGGTFLDAMREEMARSYDYTLIDSRTGLSDSSKICTQHLPDDLVVCFTLSDQSIDGAAGVARLIDDRQRDRDIRILPVPMRIDEGEKERAERGRTVARQRFRGLPKVVHSVDPAEYWGSVEIPYKAFYAYEEVLATFGDRPGHPNTVLAASERLVAELTAGAITRLPAMPEALREATAEKFNRKASVRRGDASVRLWYAVEDLMWLDWTAFVLDRAGYQVSSHRIDLPEGAEHTAGAPRSDGAVGDDADAVEHLIDIPILTRHLMRAARAREVWGPLPDGDLAAPRPATVAIRLAGVHPGTPAGHSVPLDLSSPSLDGMRAAEQLVRHLGGDDEVVALVLAELDSADAPRFPGLRTGIVSLLSRNEDFTGRAEELAKLRDRLLSRGGSERDGRAQVLRGLGGVGKSQLAREYAYRYLADYDVVWWIPAERPSSITTELAALAGRLDLDLRGGLNETDAAMAARNALTQGIPYGRWLLIFDNAEDPDSLKEFLPQGDGHVIITSRNQVWQRMATELEVDVFTPEESVAHLRRRVKGMEPGEARMLAQVLGDLPLAVEHAAAYQVHTDMSVATYMESLESFPVDMFGEAPPADYALPIKSTFAASLARLEQEWPAAKRLLEMSVFFGPEAFSQTLVYKSPEMLRHLSAHDPGLRSGPAQLGRVVNAIKRLSLAKVDGRTDTIQVHRVLQTLLRTQMTEAELEEIRTEVQIVLAAQRPLGGEVEEPENRPAFDRIRPHLAACSAELSDLPEVRQLMVDLVRLHWRNGDFEQGRAEADRIDALWSSRLGEEHEQTLALRTIRANILRDLGEYRESWELDRRTWESQCRLLGEDDPRTLATARGMAGGLRALGRYQEALERDLITYQKLLDQFMEEDRDVLSVAANLAIDYRLIGDFKSALRYNEQTQRTRRQVLGPLHARTLLSQLYLAKDKLDGGYLRDAAADLQRVREDFRATRGDDDPETLQASKSLAVSLRLLGRFKEAAEITRDTYARYLVRYGDDYPETWTCGLSLAADDWCLGNHSEALSRAEEIRERFIRSVGDHHPNSLVCADNVSVFLRAPGASENWVRRSAVLGEETTGRLAAYLGKDHLFTLCAEVNWANARAQLGQLEDAERSERSCLDRLAASLGVDHPDTLACRSNLAVTLRERGRTAEAERLHDEVVRAFTRDRNFGPTHPETVSAEKWERISHVLEVQAW